MYQHYSPEELAQQYSPSSCISDIKVYIDAYITKSHQAKKLAKKEKRVLTDLLYSENKEAKIDLYLPDTNSNTPQLTKKQLHLYIHGGYWQELSKEESSFAATTFQKQGCYFAVINYPLAPNATLSEIVEQNRLAIVWLYQHAQQYGFDKNEIYLSGSSAGAHLAMMMLMTSWSPYFQDKAPVTNIMPIKGICAVSGIYDLTPIAHTYINDLLQLTPDEIIQNSPLLTPLALLNNTTHPCHIIICYGSNETDEFKRQSQAMKDKLITLGYQVTYKEISERNHFNVILDLADNNSWLYAQVIKQMNNTTL